MNKEILCTCTYERTDVHIFGWTYRWNEVSLQPLHGGSIQKAIINHNITKYSKPEHNIPCFHDFIVITCPREQLPENLSHKKFALFESNQMNRFNLIF